MYKIELLPIAKKDIEDIIDYISNTLKNNVAAIKLSKDFIRGANSIIDLPYGSPEYEPIRQLKYNYRCVKIKNYLMFYTINENNKTITILRVLYQKMDINSVFNDKE